MSLFVYSPCKVFPYSKAFFLYSFKSSLGFTSSPVISIDFVFFNFSIRAVFSQSPNHFLNAFVRTCNHCRSVRFVSLPLGAFINVPSAIAFAFISAVSSAVL
ncbi:MAG: hypothetical protein ACFNUH_06720 [Bacteroidota bacterium]